MMIVKFRRFVQKASANKMHSAYLHFKHPNILRTRLQKKIQMGKFIRSMYNFGVFKMQIHRLHFISPMPY